MSGFRAVVDEQSRSLQQAFQFAISEENYTHGPAVAFSKTSVKVGIWQDERISLLDSLKTGTQMMKHVNLLK